MDQAFFDSAQISKTELDDLVVAIDSGQEVLQEASSIIAQAPNGSAILDVFGARASGEYDGWVYFTFYALKRISTCP